MSNWFLNPDDSALDIDLALISDTGKAEIRTILNDGLSQGTVIVPQGPLSGLTDVRITTPIQDKQVLIYDVSIGRWKNGSSTEVSSILTQNGDLLTRLAGVPARLGIGATNTLLGVSNTGGHVYRTLTTGTGVQLTLSNTNLSYSLSPTPSGTNTYLKWNGSSLSWDTVTVSNALSTLTDTLIDTPTIGQTLRYGNTGSGDRWINTLMFLADLGDVNILVLPGNRDALTYDSASQRWISRTIAQQMAGLLSTNGSIPYGLSGSVVSLPAGTSNQVLSISSSTGLPIWTTPTSGSTTLAALTDVNLTNLQNADILMYNSGSGNWFRTSIQNYLTLILTTNGDMLFRNASATPVRLPIGSTGQVLTVTGGLPTWATPATGSSSLSTLTDVQLGVLGNGSMLYYNATSNRWVSTNSILTTDGSIMTYTAASGWNPKRLNLIDNDLADVQLTSPAQGEILAYNASNGRWVNSNRLTTAEGTLSSQNTAIAALQANNQVISLSNPTTYTFAHSETTYPIVRSTYQTNAVLVPRLNGIDMSLDPAYINGSPVTGFSYGAFVPPAVQGNQQRTAAHFHAASFIFPTTTSLSAWVRRSIPVYRMNINYSGNVLQPGVYSLLGLSNDVVRIRWFGLVNPALVSTAMADVSSIPTAGSDWILLGTTTQNTTTLINITISQQVYLVAIIHDQGNSPFTTHCSTILASTSVNPNYIVGTDIGFSTATGTAVITNTTPKNSETWSLSLTNMMSYYMGNTVMKVVRGTNQLQLLNTVFDDYRVRVNNAFNNYSIQDATATNTWLQTSANGLSINGKLISLATATTPATNAVLQWNGTSFVPNVLTSSTTLGNLGDVTISGQTPGQALVWSTIANRWVNATISPVGAQPGSAGNSVSVPAFTFTSAGNYGMYMPDFQTLGLSVNGVAAMTMNANTPTTTIFGQSAVKYTSVPYGSYTLSESFSGYPTFTMFSQNQLYPMDPGTSAGTVTTNASSFIKANNMSLQYVNNWTANFWVSGHVSFRYTRVGAVADNLLIALYSSYGSAIIPGSSRYLQVFDGGIYTMDFTPRLLSMSNGSIFDIRVTPLSIGNGVIQVMSMDLSSQYVGN